MKSLQRLLLVGLVSLTFTQFAGGQSRLAIGISAAPLVGSIKYQEQLSLAGLNAGNPVGINWHQRAQGYSLSLTLRYALTSRLFVATGIALNRMHYLQPTLTTEPDLSQLSNQGQIIGISDSYRRYQIPLMLTYHTSERRLSPYFSVGCLVNLPGGTIIYETGTKVNDSNQPVRVWPTLGAGLAYQLSQPISLLAQPTFSYIFPGRPVTSYTNYQLGLQVQLICKL